METASVHSFWEFHAGKITGAELRDFKKGSLGSVSLASCIDRIDNQAIGDSFILTASRDGKISCLSKSEPRILWSCDRAGEETWSQLLRIDGDQIFQAFEGRQEGCLIRCLTFDGKTRWASTVEGSAFSFADQRNSLSISKNRVAVDGLYKGAILDRGDGRVLGRIHGLPGCARLHDRLYYVSATGQLVSQSLDKLSLATPIADCRLLKSISAWSNKLLLAETGATDKPRLLAYTASGKLLWKQTVGGYKFLEPPVISEQKDSATAYLRLDKALVAFDLSKATVKWGFQYNLDQHPQLRIIPGQDQSVFIFYGGDDTIVARLDNVGGKVDKAVCYRASLHVPVVQQVEYGQLWFSDLENVYSMDAKTLEASYGPQPADITDQFRAMVTTKPVKSF